VHLKSIQTKLFISIFLFGITLVSATLFIATYFSTQSIKEVALKNAKAQFIKNRNIIKLYTDNIEAKLFALERSAIFKRNIQNNQLQSPDLKDLFLTLAHSDNFIMQLRLLDIQGNEKIRVQRNSCCTPAYLVENKDLQNKSQRYYFKEIMSLKEGEVWTSKIDLNVEHGSIEKPLKPVLRMGTPVYKNHKKVGILVINVFMKKILQSFETSHLYNLYVIDKDGYFLIHPDSKHNWSRYLAEPLTVKDIFNDYENILTHNEYQGKNFYSATINFQNPDGIKIIVEVTDTFLTATKKDLYKKIALLAFFLLLVSFPFSYFIVRPYIKLKNNLDRLNKTLEDTAKEKSKALQELTDNFEEKLKERTDEQNVLLSLFDLGDAVLFKWRNDENWSVAHVSQSVYKLLGYTQNQFINASIYYASLIHPDDLPRVMEEVQSAIDKKLYFFTHEPYRIITKDGVTKWIHDSTVIVRDKEQNIINFVGYLIDISDIQESRIQLKKLSITDTLTQVYNRLYLDEILQKQHYRLIRNNEPCSIIIIDIDHFKKINDKYGHLVGDDVLKEIAYLIQNNIRQSDTFGRWGGEEFMIITPHTSLEEAYQLAEKIRKIVASHSFKEVGSVTISVGVSQCLKDKTLDNSITEADEALYISKRDGRNKVTKHQI
jgi:diguanylate cyclase (GGDEF)-like protein/PAS domain S-box-containing protein